MLNGHGDDGYLFGKDIVADFSSNVFYEGLADGLHKHLSERIFKLNNYPEVNAQSLQRMLGDNVLVTNGATEAFYLIAHAFRNTSATIIIPAFAEYEDACRANDIDVRYVEWADVTAITTFDTTLVFFGNPNNPTGAVLSRETIREMLSVNAGTVFIIDEAYIDFTLQDVSMVAEIGAFDNLIIVKSLTKTYSIPGLRLGYLLSNEGMIQRVLQYKMPWSVNALAIEAGVYIVNHQAALALPVARLMADAQSLANALTPYVTVYDSHTNFFLCKTDKGPAAALKLFLLHEYGILIRDAANFKSLGEGHFRVATQTPDKNALLIKGIRAWTNS
jgi:threonine-phosphate decarboxylase